MPTWSWVSSGSASAPTSDAGSGTEHELRRAFSAWEQPGRTDAIELLERLLADCQRILGSEHPVTLSARRSLADAYRKAGRNREAEAIKQHARRAAGFGRR